MGIALQTVTILIATMLGFTQIEGLSLKTPECKAGSDCGAGECCVLGMMRYSSPQCMPLGKLEDFCRDENETESKSLYYPNGQVVEATDIYMRVCPCEEGLQCVDNFCAQDDSYENNYLY